MGAFNSLVAKKKKEDEKKTGTAAVKKTTPAVKKTTTAAAGTKKTGLWNGLDTGKKSVWEGLDTGTKTTQPKPAEKTYQNVSSPEWKQYSYGTAAPNLEEQYQRFFDAYYGPNATIGNGEALGSWGRPSEQVKNALDRDTAMAQYQYMQRMKSMGLFDTYGDPSRMTNRALSKRLEELNKQLGLKNRDIESLKKASGDPNEWHPNNIGLASLSEDPAVQDMNRRRTELKRQAGIPTTAEERIGIEKARNREREQVQSQLEKDREAGSGKDYRDITNRATQAVMDGKIEGYFNNGVAGQKDVHSTPEMIIARNTTESRREYDGDDFDRAFYDHFMGDGAYDERLDALQTDEDVRQLEWDLGMAWDAFERRDVNGLVSALTGGDAENVEAARGRIRDAEKRLREINDDNLYQTQQQKKTAELEEAEKEYTELLGNKGILGDVEHFGRIEKSDVSPKEWYSDGQIRRAYDAVNGEGAYLKRTEGMTSHEKRNLDEQIREGLSQILPPHIKYADDLYTLESDARTLQDKISDTQWWYDQNEYIENMRNTPVEGDKSFHPEWDRGEVYLNSRDKTSFGGQMYEIYSYINHGKRWNLDPHEQVSGDYMYADFMEPWMIDQFNVLYNQNHNNPTEARSFLEGLQPYLRAQYYDYQVLQDRALGRTAPITSSLATVGANLAQPIMAAWMGLDTAFNGGKLARDPHSPIYRLSDFIQNVRGQVSRDVGKGWDVVYNAAMSGLDNAGNALMLGSAGLTEKALETAVLTIFGTQAFMGDMNRQMKDHVPFEKAVVKSAVDTAIETATEIASVGTLLKDPKNFILYTLQNAGVEASEEWVGETFGPYIEQMITGENDWTRRADQIWSERKDGKYTDADGNEIAIGSFEDAQRQALKEWNDQIWEATASGFISTGGSLAYQAGKYVTGQRSMGKTISEAKVEAGKTGTDTLIETAAGMRRGTRSRQLAETMKEKMSKGKKPSNYEIGKLTQLMVTESNERVALTVRETVANRTKEQLRSQGVAEEYVSRYADIITRLVSGEKISREDQTLLAGSDRALAVLRSYWTMEDGGKNRKELAEKTQDPRSVLDTIGDLLDPKGVSTNSAAAKAVAESLEESGGDTAKAAEKMAESHPELMSGVYSDAVKEELQKRANKGNTRFLDDAMKIRLRAMTMGEMPKTTLDTETARKLYETAQREFDEKDAERTKNSQPKAEPGKGTAAFDGAEYGTAAWRERMKNLRRGDRNRMGALAEIAVRAGMKVEFINDETRPDIYGMEDQDTGKVTINIAGKDSDGGKHHIFVTAGHEFTHWIEQNSPEAYKNLRKFALDRLRAKGTNVEALVIRKMDNFNYVMNKDTKATDDTPPKALDLFGAVAEIVADASDQILSSEKVMNELAGVDPTLFDKAKEFVKNFVARIRAAMSGTEASASYEGRELMKDLDQLAEMWLGGLREGQGREAGTGEATVPAGGGTSFSFAQNEESADIDYMKNFRDQLSDWLKLPDKEKKKSNKVLVLGGTPENLTKIGLVKLPLTINYRHVIDSLEGTYKKEKYRDDHIFDIEEFGHLPDMIADPVAVIKDPDPGAVRVIVSMKAKSGKETLIPFKINGRKTINGRSADVHVAKSVYGNTDTVSSLYQAIKKDTPSDPSVYYINKEKTQRALASLRKADLANFSVPDGFIHRIPESELTVNDKTYGRRRPVLAQTDTAQFRGWFGNSKVKNADGTPKIMYHGTQEQFTVFDRSKARSSGTWGKGFYFTDAQTHAGQYGNQMAVYLQAELPVMDEKDEKGRYKKRISKSQLLKFVEAIAESEDYDIDNYGYGATPQDVVNQEYGRDRGDLTILGAINRACIGDMAEAIDLFNKVNGTNFDSVITDTETVVYKPTQIKSATDNIGMFDPKNPDIRYSTAQNRDTSDWKTYSESGGEIYSRDGNGNRVKLEGRDREYVEAWNRGDFRRMEAILADKIRENGAIPFKTPNTYSNPDHRWVANAIKTGDRNAIQRAAAEMAEMVPENAVLVPMPNHYGRVDDDTDTLILAEEISRITGRPVIRALAGVERESRKENKQKPKSQQMKAADLGFRQVAEIPEGTVPYIVDNVVASGLTAQAAHEALGNRGVTLAYAKSTLSANDGLKRANVTFYDTNKQYGRYLIPLSERIDMSRTGYAGTKFSMAQLNTEYEQALKDGDEEQMRQLVYAAADLAMKDSKARGRNGRLIELYHGTEDEFFEFDTSVKGGEHGTQEGYGIYLTDSKKISGDYGKRQIAGYLNAKRIAQGDRVTFRKNELTRLIKATCEAEAKQKAEDEGYGSAKEALNDTWISNYVNTTEYRNFNDACADAADSILQFNDNDNDIIQEVMVGMAIRDYGRAMDFYHNFLTPITGYDAMRTEWKDRDGKKFGTVYVAFDSSQIKSSEPVTYDNDGKPIPLSERFNPEKKDIRYSTAQALNGQETEEGASFSVRQQDMDVTTWMLGLSESSLATVQERNLLKQFKDKRMEAEISRKAVREQSEKIRRLEAKENMTAYDRHEVIKARNILDIRTKKLERAEEDLIKITSDKGFAGMMYRQQRLMSDLVNGRTAEEVRRTAGALDEKIREVSRQIDERAKRLDAMAKKEEVIMARSYFEGAGLKKAAADLKKQLNSSIRDEEIESRLAAITLKFHNSEDFTTDLQELTQRLTETARGEYESYALGELRGETFLLSASQMAELKAQHRTLREVAQALKGTGIWVLDGSKKSGGTLDMEWDELCDRIPSLERDINDKDMLDNLLDLVRSEQQAAKGAGWITDTDGVQQMAFDKVLELEPGIGGKVTRAQYNALLTYIRQMNGETREASEAMKGLQREIAGLKSAAGQTDAAAAKIDRNIGSAIEYFNSLTEQSEAVIWRRERTRLIEQMKNEKTEALLAEQAKWKEKIEKDKTVREMMTANMHKREQISTVVGRVRKLLANETDQKNIPEHMKGLAREMLSLFVKNDLLLRKVSLIDKKKLIDTKRLLDIWKGMYGPFELKDLQSINDEEVQSVAADALADIEDGIHFWNATGGKDIKANLQGYKNALDRIQQGVNTIWGVIEAENSVMIGDRKIAVRDAADDVARDLEKSRFRGEYAGKTRKAREALHRMIVSGNMTPVYFFRNLRNAGMEKLWKEVERGENRYGLEIGKAQRRMDEIAEETGYNTWDLEKKYDVRLGGESVKMTLEQMMALYATWVRESQAGPEESNHLTRGGVYIDEGEIEDGIAGRKKVRAKARRVTAEEIEHISSLMTPEQHAYLEKVVSYLSNEMSELGNETSMKMYGINKYNEKYYFPMQVWDGVKSARSDKGLSGNNENRAASRSWSKRRVDRASNALVIGNFTEVATKHIAEMITYNTMAPAIENINKVMNSQYTEGYADTETKRNLWTMFQEAYGREALNYLETLKKDMNGGAVEDKRKTLGETALRIFKKNAVAGSLSVALQQPLSYIRAAMMVNPKYLSRALFTKYWNGSYGERMKYSGVSVIKDMGPFDMNLGASAQDYLKPDQKQTALRKAWDKICEYSTILPELGDRWTWNRLWVAVKAEQADLHRDMDTSGEEFLQLVAERFNEVMRMTQVYDSLLVKSSNMRSRNPAMKAVTSFMAEPTLTLNMLRDAVINADKPGGKTRAAKAGALFLLSAAAQAAMKALLSAGRSPDDRKNKAENFMNKFWYNAVSEMDPMQMIPGFGDIISILKGGEITDDALTVLTKIPKALMTARDAIAGKGKGWYRDLEDSAAQLSQIFTGVPAKNIMRDLRAMYNWFINPDAYANRETSGAVMKYQAVDTAVNADNLIGVLNSWLGDAGYVTTTKAYEERLYGAMMDGNDGTAEELKDYLVQVKVSGKDAASREKKLKIDLNSMAVKDSDGDIQKRLGLLRDNGYTKTGSFVIDQYQEGNLNRAEAEGLYRQEKPKASDKEVFTTFDKADYEIETGEEAPSSFSGYTRLYEAIEGNKAKEIEGAVQRMMKGGYTAEAIQQQLRTKYAADYAALPNGSAGKVKMKDGLVKALKATGMNAELAGKTVSETWQEKGDQTNAKNAVESAFERFEKGEITIDQAVKLIKKENPTASENDIWYELDRAVFQKQTGVNPGRKTYYRLYYAIDNRDTRNLSKIIKDMVDHGVKKSNIKNKLMEVYGQELLSLSGSEQVSLRNSLEQAMKAAGESNPSKHINDWIKRNRK